MRLVRCVSFAFVALLIVPAIALAHGTQHNRSRQDLVQLVAFQFVAPGGARALGMKAAELGRLFGRPVPGAALSSCRVRYPAVMVHRSGTALTVTVCRASPHRWSVVGRRFHWPIHEPERFEELLSRARTLPRTVSVRALFRGVRQIETTRCQLPARPATLRRIVRAIGPRRHFRIAAPGPGLAPGEMRLTYRNGRQSWLQLGFRRNQAYLTFGVYAVRVADPKGLVLQTSCREPFELSAGRHARL